ncbi:hypothetical protein [uncultured Draconibacterium sp.]|uniref:hypothetical protein n=1 Tax=uncultured Draconibacterium sp. TaxID=1573823 RepID=UPI0029C7A123|nr:hypothetical protein [uncultured Draconibacterium sp.]
MRISQFQKYSQKENTVTNNILLMLSRLNDLKVEYYENIIESINDGIQEYHAQAIFRQQIGTKRGIIDGYIEIKASKIVIETKLSQKELINKLIRYGEVFGQNSQNQLWHLSSKKYNEEEVKLVNSKLKEQYPNVDIQFNNLLFSDILDNLEEIYNENDHDHELRLLLEDFRNYCFEEGLIDNSKHKLLFAPTGWSYDWNIKHKMYFCPTDWHKQEFTYFGLYKDKSVRTISKIETTIIADFNVQSQELDIHSTGHTERQIKRLKDALIAYNESQTGLKYYILPEDKFYYTDFKKKSMGGIQGFRYKDLSDYLDENDLKNTEQIANSLRSKTWI